MSDPLHILQQKKDELMSRLPLWLTDEEKEVEWARYFRSLTNGIPCGNVS